MYRISAINKNKDTSYGIGEVFTLSDAIQLCNVTLDSPHSMPCSISTANESYNTFENKKDLEDFKISQVANLLTDTISPPISDELRHIHQYAYILDGVEVLGKPSDNDEYVERFADMVEVSIEMKIIIQSKVNLAAICEMYRVEHSMHGHEVICTDLIDTTIIHRAGSNYVVHNESFEILTAYRFEYLTDACFLSALLMTWKSIKNTYPSVPDNITDTGVIDGGVNYTQIKWKIDEFLSLEFCDWDIYMSFIRGVCNSVGDGDV